MLWIVLLLDVWLFHSSEMNYFDTNMGKLMESLDGITDVQILRNLTKTPAKMTKYPFCTISHLQFSESLKKCALKIQFHSSNFYPTKILIHYTSSRILCLVGGFARFNFTLQKFPSFRFHLPIKRLTINNEFPKKKN